MPALIFISFLLAIWLQFSSVESYDSERKCDYLNTHQISTETLSSE